MAFGDNDIKIKVTLDTEEAQKSAEQLKASVEKVLKSIEGPFQKIASVTKEAVKLQIAQIKATTAENKKQLDVQKQNYTDYVKFRTSKASDAAAKEVELIRAATQRDKIAANERAKALAAARKVEERQLQVTAQTATNLRNASLVQEINASNKKVELIKFETKIKIAEIKKQQALEAQALKNAGKAQVAQALKGVSSGLGKTENVATTFSALSFAVGSLSAAFGGLGPVIGLTGVAIGAVTIGVSKLAGAVTTLAAEGNRISDLQIGFSNLQRSLGYDPDRTIVRLREATQGLISDTELYQRANQAALLNVPTDIFLDAAAAAVKLGKAMGIDAAFGLESLSLGLGRQSRLYLDNLGIVVSATQAYKNFALANGLVADELTDAQKRAAFFAEAQKALKDRAAELPPIAETAGNAFTKVTNAAERLYASFVKGFNSSPLLAKAFENLAKGLPSLSGALEAIGFRFGEFVGEILQGNSELGAFVRHLSSVVKLAGRFAESFDPARQRLESLREAAAQARSEYEKIVLDQSSTSIFSKKPTSGQLAESKKIAEDTQKAFFEAWQAFGRGAKAPINVPIRVNLEELSNDLANQESSVDNFVKGLREGLGQFSIPQVNNESVAKLKSEIQALSLEANSGKISVQQYSDAVRVAISNVVEEAGLKRLESTRKAIADLKAENEKFKLANAGQEIDGFVAKLATLEATQKELSKTSIVDPTVIEAAIRAANDAADAGKKAAEEQAQEAKKQANELKEIREREKKELQDFRKAIIRETGRAIPVKFQEKLLEIYQSGVYGTDKFIERLVALREEFKAAGGDVEALQQAVSDYNRLVSEGANPQSFNSSADIEKARLEEKQRIEDLLEDVPKVSKAFNDLFGSDFKTDGGFFGFDLGEAFGANKEERIKAEKEIGAATQDLFATGFQLGLDGFNRDDVPALVSSALGAAGSAIGAYIGGPMGAQVGQQIGTIIGDLIGDSVAKIGDDKPGTKERKAIDKYFGELFQEQELAFIIEKNIRGAIEKGVGKLRDFTFEGDTLFGGNVDFGGDNFSSYFSTLSTEIQATFNGVGLALGTLQGTAIEQSVLIGTALANNIGGSLVNLQMVVQATGESFETLSEAIINAFYAGELTLQQAYDSLAAVQKIFERGIPDAIGAVDLAVQNFQAAIADPTAGRLWIKTFRDIAFEIQETGTDSVQVLVNRIGQAYGFTSSQIAVLFQSFKQNGINSISDFVNAGSDKLITLLRQLELIQKGQNEILSTPTEPQGAPITPPAFTPRFDRGGAGNSAADNRKRELEQFREQVNNLLRESQRYADILKKLTANELSSIQGGKAIIELREKISKTLRTLNNLEEQYQKELDKGTKANKRRLAELAERIDKTKKKFEDYTEKVKDTAEESRRLDLVGVIPLITDLNKLGVISKQAGVTLKSNTDILIRGFLQGRLSLTELNSEISKTKDLLGPGIPKAVGAVTDAFQNLIDAGREGGAFSVDAFLDVFAEFREKFNKEGSALREAQRQELVANLEAAKAAFNSAIGPDAVSSARTALEQAKKSLEEFYSLQPKPDLSDLRAELEQTFGSNQVNVFFRALAESGLTSFDDFEKAGVDSVVGILQRLEELGFQFNETSDDIKNVNQGLQDAEKSANNGLDPLKQAIDLVKQFNDGAAGLPPVFNSTSAAIGSLNGPLTQLASGFDNLIEKLGRLSGNTFENDVVFNVRTVGDQASQNLADIVFGDGANVGGEVGGDGPGVKREIAKLRSRLNRLRKSGKGDSKEANKIRSRIRELKELL